MFAPFQNTVSSTAVTQIVGISAPIDEQTVLGADDRCEHDEILAGPYVAEHVMLRLLLIQLARDEDPYDSSVYCSCKHSMQGQCCLPQSNVLGSFDLFHKLGTIYGSNGKQRKWRATNTPTYTIG